VPADTPEKLINPKKLAMLPKLPEAWVERMATERGWTPEAITEAGLRLFTHGNGTERIAFPIFDGEGNLPNIRLYLPKAKGKQLKMINWFEGTGPNKVTYGGDRLWPHPSTWVEGPVWLVEGEPDRVAGLSHKMPGNVVTRTGGARSWKDEWTECFRDREVILCLDADKVGLAGVERVAGELLGVASKIHAVIWPEFMWKETPHPLFDENKSLEDYSEFIREFGAEYPANHGEDLTDFFHKHGCSLDDLINHIAAGGCIEYEPEATPDLPTEDLPDEPPTEDDNPSLSAIRRRFFVWQSGWKFKPPLLRDEILAARKFVADPLTKQLYEYESRYWKMSSVEFVEALAADMMGIEAETARVANAARLVYLRSLLPEDRSLNDHHHLICFENGMLDISEGPDAGTFYPHSPDYLATQMLPYRFDEAADCPLWKATLEDYHLSKSAQLQLQQFFGYCLTRETKYAKALLLKGDGADGKSVILNILRAIIGEENCSAVQMSRLEDPFERATLYGKLLNISTEENKGIFGSAIFKSAVSGDLMNASFKHKDFFQFRPYAKHAFASNFFPNVSDTSDGFYRRLLAIKFTRQFAEHEQDKNLEKKLLNERSGICNWAIAGLISLREMDGFAKSEESLEFLGEYRRHNNPVLSFTQEWCKTPAEGEDLRVSVDELYEAYCIFCTKDGYKKMQKNNFGETLRQVAKVKSVRLLSDPAASDISKTRPRGYGGIDLTQEARTAVAARTQRSSAGGSAAPPAAPDAAGRQANSSWAGDAW
jgi:putative DNA primase/helicase